MRETLLLALWVRALESIQRDTPTSALRETLERWWTVTAAMQPPPTRWLVVEETSLPAQQVGRVGKLVARGTLLLAPRGLPHNRRPPRGTIYPVQRTPP